MNLILPSSQSLVWSLTRPVMKGPVLIITRSTVLLLAPHSSYFFDAKVMQVMETNEYKEAPDLEKDPRWRSTFRFRGGGVRTSAGSFEFRGLGSCCHCSY